jgi:hypothetical protein
MARKKSHHSEGALRLEKGFFYSFNGTASGRAATPATFASSACRRDVNCTGYHASFPMRWSAGGSPTNRRRSWAPKPTAACATPSATPTTPTPLTRTATTTAVRLDQRQDQRPHRAHPPRLFHLRQDHRNAQRPGLPRHLSGQARPGRSGDQLHHPRFLRRRVPHAAAQRRARRGLAREVPFALLVRRCRVHGCALAGADRRQLRPRRHLLRRQARRLEPVQHRGRPSLRRHDVGRTRFLHLLQRRAHRAGGQGR